MNWHWFTVLKDIFACLFSIHNIISLSCHEQGPLKHTCSWHDKLIIYWFTALGQQPYPVCHAKHQNDIFSSTQPPTPEIEYVTKIENITIKITKSFLSFHTWHFKLYNRAFRFCSRKFWEVCVTFNSKQFQNNFKLGQNFSVPYLL